MPTNSMTAGMVVAYGIGAPPWPDRSSPLDSFPPVVQPPPMPLPGPLAPGVTFFDPRTESTERAMLRERRDKLLGQREIATKELVSAECAGAAAKAKLGCIDSELAWLEKALA